MNFMIGLLVLVLIIILGYALVNYLSRQQQQINQTLTEKNQKLLAVPIADKLYTLKNKAVTGNTKRAFENIQADWRSMTQYQLPEIEAALVSMDTDTKKYHLVRARQTSDKVERLLQKAQKRMESLEKGLDEIIGQEEKNEKQQELLYDRYTQIRKQLLAHSYAYGPSEETLTENLSYIELDFTKFHDQTNEGDFFAARDVLTQIEDDLNTLEKMMAEIPELLTRIDDVYLEQLEELDESYRRMKQEDFLFPKDINVAEEIAEADKIVNNTRLAITNADLDQARALMKRAEIQIDRCYELMEVELLAKRYVESHQGAMQQQLTKVHRSNRNDLLELDRISQNYVLVNGEKEALQDYADEIDRLKDTIDRTDQQLGNQSIAYSDMQIRYEDTFKQLEEIDHAQAELLTSLGTLKQEERQARTELYRNELTLRQIMRQVSRYHLPGLKQDYLDRYFAAEDLLKSLRKKMNRVKLDMAAIHQEQGELKELLTYLTEEIDNIFACVDKLEVATQYANRYRATHPEISKAIEKSRYYFNERYDYDQALEEILTTVDQINPEGSKEIDQLWQDKQ